MGRKGHDEGQSSTEIAQILWNSKKVYGNDRVSGIYGYY